MRPSVFICALTALVGQNKPIFGSPSLLFQLDPNPDASSFEAWSDAQLSSSFPSDQPFGSDEEVPIDESIQWARTEDVDSNKAPAVLDMLQGVLASIYSAGQQFNPFPWHHHELPPVDLPQYTIAEVLTWVLKHPSKSFEGDKEVPPLHRVAWLANLSAPIQAILSDPNLDLTFFAPDDQALTPPSKRPPPHHSLLDDESTTAGYELYWKALEELEELHKPSQFGHFPDEKHKKEFLIKVAGVVLKNHIIPKSRKISEIHEKSTIPTSLKISPKNDSPAFRLRVGKLGRKHPRPGKLTLNFFTKVDTTRYRPILTKNGVIYIASRVPLFPPFSPLGQLFLFPKQFAILTSGIQQVRLDDHLLPHFNKKSLHFLSEPFNSLSQAVSIDDKALDLVDQRIESVIQSLIEENPSFSKRSFTVFAPNNRALAQLDPHLTAFLFSPFGAHILRYVLAYHLVPDVIWYTDHVDNVPDYKSIVTRYESGVDLTSDWNDFLESPTVPPHLPDLHGKVNVTEFSLPTLLGTRKNESLAVSLVEFKRPGSIFTTRRVFVKQHGFKESFTPPKDALPVIVPDVTAWGGAIHVVPQLIRPPIPQGHRGREDVERAIELALFQ